MMKRFILILASLGFALTAAHAQNWSSGSLPVGNGNWGGGFWFPSGVNSISTAYLLFVYGQSTGAAVEPTVSSATGSTSGGTLTITAGGTNNGPFGVGAPVNCGTGGVGLAKGTTITAIAPTLACGAGGTTACTGTGVSPYTGTYAISDTTTVGSGTCYFVPTSVTTGNGFNMYAPLTTSLPYNNAYMINAGGSSPRALVDSYTAAVTNINQPMSSTANQGWAGWSGFTGLRENSYNIQGSIGAQFYVETVTSSMAAEVMPSIASSNALVAMNMSRWAVGWAKGGCAPAGGYSTVVIGQCTAPGSSFWADMRLAQLYAKQQIQYGSNALANNPGTLNTQVYAVGLRLGEAVAGRNQYSGLTGGTGAFTAGVTTSITMSSSNATSSTAVNPGDAIYDNTAGCWVGYVHSFVGTTLTFAGNDPTGAATAAALCSSTASTDVLYFSEAGNYKNELADVVKQVNSNAFDASDTPSGNVPVVALQPSTETGSYGTFAMQTFAMPFVYEALADKRFILAGGSYPAEYIDSVHNSSRGNALLGAYMGKWLKWWKAGRRTVPFIMTQAVTIAPNAANCDATHYCIRVFFQMPPTDTPAEAVIQSYCASGCTTTDSNIPALNNSSNYWGFYYTDSQGSTDGRIPGPNSSLWNCSAAAGSGITIASAKLAASETNPGPTNAIDLVTSSTAIDPATQANPTVCYGGWQAVGKSYWGGAANQYQLAGNIADRACDQPTNTALLGQAFKNAACGTGNNFLPDFAAQSVVMIGAAALAPAW